MPLQKLSKEREERLEALPDWSWDPHEDGWEKGFTALLSFKKICGHVVVDQEYVFYRFRLGRWVAKQRYRRDELSTERLGQLKSLGFVWKTEERQT